MVVDLIDRRTSGGDGAPAMATVVFFDIVGSTDAMARLEEDDWLEAVENARDLLDLLMDYMADVIREFGGTVARVQGDGVMAVFGAPKPLEKHAINACAAALKIRDHFRDRMLMVGPGMFAAVRIGVHFGRIITRIRRNDMGSDLDIVGLTAHRAKKVEVVCPPNAALVTLETLQIAGAAVEARHWEAGLFELVGVVPHHDLGQQFPADLLEPFVGRTEILDRLIANVGEARGFKAKTVALVGEAGVGKSRILFEVSRKAESHGFRVIEMRGHAVHALTPFAPVKPLVAKLLQSGGESVAASLAARKLPPLLEQGILELVGAKTDDDWNKIDGPSRRRAMIEAACILVAQTVKDGPLLIVADDAHNFDPETHDFVARLKTLSAEAALAIVATARNVARDPTPSVADEVITLDLLSENQAWQFARSTAAGAPIDHADMARAVKNAAGNPLFLQSLIRDLRNGKTGEGTPAELTSLVQTRIGQLSDGARTVLWAISVLRANFARRTLAATVAVDEAALEPLLTELERQDLIAVDAAGVRFRHDLFRRAVDELLLRRERHELHRRAWMALDVPPRSAELLDQLTFHAEMAGDHAGALAYLLQAITLAVRSSSLKTVRALYARAKNLKGNAGADAVPAFVAVSIASLDALQQSGDREEYRTALEFVAEYTARIGDHANEARARSHLALMCWMRAEHETGFRHASAALEIARDLKSLELRALAQPHLANIEHARGNLDTAITLHTEIVADLEGEHEASTLGRMIIPSVRSRAFLAWFLIERGRLDEARAQIDRADEILLAIDQPYSRVLANAARGLLALRTGRARDAIAPLEIARNLCFDLQFYVMEPCVSGWLASALCELGEFARAREIASRSVDTKLYEHGGRYTWVFVHVGYAEALFGCGETDGALAKAAKAIEIAEESHEPINIAQARFTHGRMLTRLGRVERGLAEMRAALVLAERHGLDPLARECRGVIEQFSPN